MNKIDKDVNRVEVAYESSEDGIFPHVLNICGEDLMAPGAKMSIQTMDVHFAPDDLPRVKLTMCPEIVELKLESTNTVVQVGPFLFTPDVYKKEILPFLQKHCWNSAGQEEEQEEEQRMPIKMLWNGKIINGLSSEEYNKHRFGDFESKEEEEEQRMFPAGDPCACCERESGLRQLLCVRTKDGIVKKAYCPECLQALIEETQKPRGNCYIGESGELCWRKKGVE